MPPIGSGWNGASAHGGQDTGGTILLSGALRTDPRGSTCSFAGNVASYSRAAQRHPTEPRTFSALRVTLLENTTGVPVTIALCKNGASTVLSVVVPKGAAQFYKGVDALHTLRFTDGDDFDVMLSAEPDASGGGNMSVSIMLK